MVLEMNGLIKKKEKGPSKADSRRIGIILVGEVAILRVCFFSLLLSPKFGRAVKST